MSRWGRLACLAFLFALWANLHSSFVFGLGGLVLWAVTERARWRWVELGVATLACLGHGHTHVHGLLLPLRYVRASLQPTGRFFWRTSWSGSGCRPPALWASCCWPASRERWR